MQKFHETTGLQLFGADGETAQVADPCCSFLLDTVCQVQHDLAAFSDVGSLHSSQLCWQSVSILKHALCSVLPQQAFLCLLDELFALAAAASLW